MHLCIFSTNNYYATNMFFIHLCILAPTIIVVLKCFLMYPPDHLLTMVLPQYFLCIGVHYTVMFFMLSGC